MSRLKKDYDENPPIGPVLEYYGFSDIPDEGDARWRPIQCEFHDDQNASASVNMDLGALVCHGCGMKGNAITIIMRKEGLNAAGAIRHYEKLVGEDFSRVSQPTRSTRRRVSNGKGDNKGKRRTLSSRRSSRTRPGSRGL